MVERSVWLKRALQEIQSLHQSESIIIVARDILKKLALMGEELVDIHLIRPRCYVKMPLEQGAKSKKNQGL